LNVLNIRTTFRVVLDSFFFTENAVWFMIISNFVLKHTSQHLKNKEHDDGDRIAVTVMSKLSKKNSIHEHYKFSNTVNSVLHDIILIASSLVFNYENCA